MTAFPGKYVFPVLTLKFHAIAGQKLNNLSGTANHHFHRLRIVPVMSGFHGVLIIRIVVLLRPKHTNAPLRQKGIAVLSHILGDNGYFCTFRKLQCTKQPGSSGAYNYNICLFLHDAS